MHIRNGTTVFGEARLSRQRCGGGGNRRMFTAGYHMIFMHEHTYRQGGTLGTQGAMLV